jgi:hypothetical protein
MSFRERIGVVALDLTVRSKVALIISCFASAIRGSLSYHNRISRDRPRLHLRPHPRLFFPPDQINPEPVVFGLP